MTATEKLVNKLEKRIADLEEWIDEEGKRTNTCTFSILKEVCSDCKCGKKENRNVAP